MINKLNRKTEEPEPSVEILLNTTFTEWLIWLIPYFITYVLCIIGVEIWFPKYIVGAMSGLTSVGIGECLKRQFLIVTPQHVMLVERIRFIRWSLNSKYAIIKKFDRNELFGLNFHRNGTNAVITATTLEGKKMRWTYEDVSGDLTRAAKNMLDDHNPF